eukprot:642262-Rhodomonas_salina.2
MAEEDDDGALGWISKVRCRATRAAMATAMEERMMGMGARKVDGGGDEEDNIGREMPQIVMK